MRSAVRTIAVAVALSLLAACGDGDDAAAPARPASSPPASSPTDAPPTDAPPTDAPSATTELAITLDESGEGAVSNQRTYRLTCEPDGGDHPYPADACAVLAELGADAFAAPPKDQQCTEQYGGPQTASVTGVVDGEPVQATFDRTNGCGIARWDALGPVLAAQGSLGGS